MAVQERGDVVTHRDFECHLLCVSISGVLPWNSGSGAAIPWLVDGLLRNSHGPI